MVKTLILYESKYGFTKKISEDLSLILGPAKYCCSSEFTGDIDIYDVVVICSPVYLESLDHRILEFVKNNTEKLKKKRVILICTCLADKLAAKYLKPLKDMLGRYVVFEAGVCGQIDFEKLSSDDSAAMERFCKLTGFSLDSCNSFDKNAFAELALKIKKIKDEGEKVAEDELLKAHIEDFINKHNTCALATGHGDSVRATPIEYNYFNGCIYLLSEGGEKFSNLLINPNVSITIYDEFKGMNELGGMQIAGTAELIEIGSEEYISILDQKNIKYEKIKSLPIALNMVKINIGKIEFLWSGFGGLGYDVRQVLSIG